MSQGRLTKEVEKVTETTVCLRVSAYEWIPLVQVTDKNEEICDEVSALNQSGCSICAPNFLTSFLSSLDVASPPRKNSALISPGLPLIQVPTYDARWQRIRL